MWSDVRFALRQLRKAPGFAATAICTLAVGIAAAVAIFGFVDSALIRPLPYPDPARLVGVFETSPADGRQMGYSYLNYVDLQRGNRVFASIAGFNGSKEFVLTDAEGAHKVKGIGLTSEFFRILGVTPILGEDFAANSDKEDLRAAPSTVMLSYAAWQRWFGGRPDVLGKAVTLSGESYTVTGVLPSGFQFAPTGATEFWTTLRPFATDSCAASRGCAVVGVVARLKDGATVQAAMADVWGIAEQEAELHPDPDRNRRATVVPVSQVVLGDTRPILLTLLGGAGLLLLIVYVNVMGLLVARSENRRSEFAVRGALGAGLGRLMQQFIIEGFVIVATSGALGLFAATSMQHLLVKLVPAAMLESMPYLRGIGWNWHTAPFAAAVMLIAWALLGMASVQQLSFANLHAGLAEGGRGGSGMAWRHLGAKLVVLELATTIVLLAAAGLLAKSFYNLLHVQMGFVPSHLAMFSVVAPEAKYSSGGPALVLQREVLRRVGSLPGITAAGATGDLPVGSEGGTQIGFVDKPSLGVNNPVGHIQISPTYLAVLEARLLKGRYFTENDNSDAPLVAIINETLVRQYFGAENPVGRQFFYHAHDIRLETSQPPIEIVGVIADVKQNALDEPATPVVYTPFAQGPEPFFAIAARTSQDAAAALPSLVAAIREIDPGIVTSDAATMPEIIAGSPAAYWHRASAWLAGSSAALALGLSVVGLYGVMAYSVGQRTREIGVRMALGATPGSVYVLILREAGGLILIGLVVGICGAIAAGMLMRSLLFGVRSWDVSILGGVAAASMAAGMVASYVPARRAAGVNPVEALRAE